MAGLIVGCAHENEANYQLEHDRIQQMSLMQAQETIRAYRGKTHLHYLPVQIQITWFGLRFIYQEGPSDTCRFDRVILKTYYSHARLACCPSVHNKNPLHFDSLYVNFEDKSELTRFLDAVHILKQNYFARTAPESPQQQAAFDAIVKQFRAGQFPPTLPEGAQRYKAQAEFAVKQKRFDDAIDLYGKALEVAPWWPQGRYNRGQLLGELEAYTEAVRELQKYLKFAPEAPNAQAVQTLIYQWESLTPGNR